MDEIELPKELRKLAIKNFYEYIRVKAERFLTIGHTQYRKDDAFNQPDERLSNKNVELLKTGCLQVLEYKGLTEETAFEGIGIEGVYKLMALFHYKVVSQSIDQNEIDFFIDEMNMEHVVTGQKMKLFNKIPKKKSKNRTKK